MKEKRYYFDGKLYVGVSITLEGDEFHHLSNVMRAREGGKVCLINGDGNFYFSTISKLNKKSAEIKVENKKVSTCEPSINLTIFQALAKGDKLSLITQKVSELGANKLCLFESKFTDVKSNSHKAERLDTIAISASKQCGRASILEIEGIISIKDIALKIHNYDAFFVAYENEDGHTLVNSLLKLDKTCKNIAIMIGAEGGFAESEINSLREGGADIVSLGNRILRTETASIAATAQIFGILEKL